MNEAVDPEAVPPPARAVPLPPSFNVSAVVASIKSGWSSMPQKPKFIVAIAAVAFFLFAAVIGVSILGAVASRVFTGSETLQCQVGTVNGSYGNQQLNAGIKNLKVVKNTRKGTVTISFDWKAKAAGYPYQVGQGLLVRLFDRNGRYLTHFTTQETFLDIMGQHEDGWEGDRFELTYPMNERDLAVAAMAEVGGII